MNHLIAPIIRQPYLLLFSLLVMGTLAATAGCDEDALRVPTPRASTSAAATAVGAARPAPTVAHGPTKAGAKPQAGAPIDEQGRMHVGDADRCPVCAMRVKEHPKFASGIELGDGTSYYFCGTGCMLRTWLHPEVFLGVPKDRLRRGIVRDYFQGEHLDASAVVWVAGSDVVGPMGPAIVPLADEASAETFRKRHGGKHTFKLSELDDATWEQMTGKKASR